MNTLKTPNDITVKTDDTRVCQQQILKDFFLKDRRYEMIESLNALIEPYLFTENLASVTSEMREHIVNQLRVATLIAKLDASNSDIANNSPAP